MGRERIIERERRWAVPAGVVALAPLVLYIASIIIVQRAHLVGGSSEADQLASLDEHSATVLVSSIVRGIGFLLLPIPILYLFRAAQARNPRVQAAMVGFQGKTAAGFRQWKDLTGVGSRRRRVPSH